MDLSSKNVVVTGGTGFLGWHVVEGLKRRGLSDDRIFIPRSKEFDLRCLQGARSAISGDEIVIHLAAHVGGIGLNQAIPGELYYDNAAMCISILEAARLEGVEKFVGIGTICSYPKHTPVPFKESELFSGYPEETNAPYGLAKKMLLVQAQAYRQQYGLNAIMLLPVNLYGPRDNFNPKSSHVIPALIHKIARAQKAKVKFIECWGTGQASREFLFVDDAAEAIVTATQEYNKPEPVNIGSGREITIKELVETIARIMKFDGEIRWDATKPDGQPRRCLDVSRAREEFGFVARTSFEEGLDRTIAYYHDFMAGN